MSAKISYLVESWGLKDLWLGWFSVARTAFFFLISDIKLEALRSQVASGGAHISLFGCLMLVLQKAVVGGPSPFH